MSDEKIYYTSANEKKLDELRTLTDNELSILAMERNSANAYFVLGERYAAKDDKENSTRSYQNAKSIYLKSENSQKAALASVKVAEVAEDKETILSEIDFAIQNGASYSDIKPALKRLYCAEAGEEGQRKYDNIIKGFADKNKEFDFQMAAYAVEGSTKYYDSNTQNFRVATNEILINNGDEIARLYAYKPTKEELRINEDYDPVVYEYASYKGSQLLKKYGNKLVGLAYNSPEKIEEEFAKTPKYAKILIDGLKKRRDWYYTGDASEQEKYLQRALGASDIDQNKYRKIVVDVLKGKGYTQNIDTLLEGLYEEEWILFALWPARSILTREQMGKVLKAYEYWDNKESKCLPIASAKLAYSEIKKEYDYINDKANGLEAIGINGKTAEKIAKHLPGIGRTVNKYWKKSIDVATDQIDKWIK